MRKRTKMSVTIYLIILLAPASLWSQQYIYDGNIIDRPGFYDGYPTHMYIDGVHHMWFCSLSTSTANWADGIFYTTKTGALSDTSGWATPVEVLNHEGITWMIGGEDKVNNHVCDPSVIAGDFWYGGASYRYALYFTADLSGPGVTGDNATGVAYSNDGISWIAHDLSVIEPDNGYDGSYCAGAGDSAWGPEPNKIVHLYRDSTALPTTEWRIRYKESVDSLLFSPTPSLDTPMSEASESDVGSAPVVAFNPINQTWYGSIQNIGGGDPFGIRIINATEQNTLFSVWETQIALDSSVSGEEGILLPGLARNENSSLLIDSEGYAYLFFTTGERRPNVDTWRIDQLRYRVTSPAVVRDTFTNMSPTRDQGDHLAGTTSEIGSREWVVNWEKGKLTSGHLSAETMTDASFTAGLPFDPAIDVGPPGSPSTITLEADADPSGSGWVGIGFSSSTTGNLWEDGKLWMLIRESAGNVEVWADGTNELLFVGPPPGFSSGLNQLRLSYDVNANIARAFVNGQELVLSDLGGYQPTGIQGVSFQMVSPTEDQTKIDDFQLRWWVNHVFSNGFESGSTDEWSSTCPPDCDP